jgi:predicted MPP superfamily phosphohydrolase
MKKKKDEYVSETKEFKKLELEEKDNIETIDELVLKEKLKLRRKRIKMIEIILLIVLIIAGFICYARFVSTKGLIIKEHAIKSTELPQDYDGLKLLQFSDVHYGSTIFEKELDTLIETINDQNPDIVIFTGDLIEEKVELTNTEIENLIEKLNKIEATAGLYAVKGNHDYSSDYFDTIFEKTNFKVLKNESDLVYYKSTTPIRIVGIDDDLKGNPNFEEAFKRNEEEEVPYTILLIHEPDQIDKIKDDYPEYNITFAGHSHLGQVRIPIIGALYTPVGSKKYYEEHNIINNKDMYINGGLGTSLLRLRFFNKPSITLYRFYSE